MYRALFTSPSWLILISISIFPLTDPKPPNSEIKRQQIHEALPFHEAGFRVTYAPGIFMYFFRQKMQPLSYVVCHLCPMFLLTSFALNKMFNKHITEL